MKKIIALIPIAFLAGCYTISESQYPNVEMSRSAADTKLQLEGFQATVVDYTPMYTSSVVMDGPAPHPRHWGWGAPTTVYSETIVPTVRNTDIFLNRATANLENAGFILRATPPAKYTVSVTFGGPIDPDGADNRRIAYDFCTLFFSLYDTVAFTADMKIYNPTTGKVVFSRKYEQTYEAHGWSPLWIIGMMSYDKIDPSFMKSWCLNALTDRVCADASAFIVQAEAKK